MCCLLYPSSCLKRLATTCTFSSLAPTTEALAYLKCGLALNLKYKFIKFIKKNLILLLNLFLLLFISLRTLSVLFISVIVLF